MPPLWLPFLPSCQALAEWGLENPPTHLEGLWLRAPPQGSLNLETSGWEERATVLPHALPDRHLLFGEVLVCLTKHGKL
jgi:hypothetical protein